MAEKKKTVGKKAKVEEEDERDFEEALGALEEIVEAMESDRMPLADMLTKYDEGTRLLKLCQRRIDEAQAKIELISRKAESDEVELVDFDPSEVEMNESTVRREVSRNREEGEEIELL
ncbi:MAG: exodeoxyribonuclease VII small subunit [Verrucomicrobiota bacterium]